MSSDSSPPSEASSAAANPAAANPSARSYASTNLPSYEQLEPRAIWRYFAGMSEVPRPSKKEDRIRAHMRQLCEEQGLQVDEDKVGNLVVRVPASPGREGVPIVVLQAHLDMVCEKNAGTEHDFDRDPIRLLVDRDPQGALIVRADGTTLGADNGIGVCMALAAASAGATEADLVHGPLELLFTVDEEEGMSGAEGLDGSLIHGRTLLNLDTEEDDTLYIGCAGGCDTTLTWKLPTEKTSSPTWKVSIRGLRGGHSGGDIHQGRGSATQLAARILGRLLDGTSDDAPQLIDIQAGSKRNAIAREASFSVALRDAEHLRSVAAQVQADGRDESNEPDLHIDVESVGGSSPRALSADDTHRVVEAWRAVHHGVAGMDPGIPELVETSNNLATIRSHDTAGQKTLEVGCLSRSSTDSRMEEILDHLAAVGRLAGAEVERANAYPGWRPRLESDVLTVCRQVHEELFGVEAEAKAVHAGLECGLLGEKVPGLDMVSLGPRIEGAHSPDERVWVESVERSWVFLKGILRALADGAHSQGDRGE